MIPFHMATLFSHFWICQLDRLSGQDLQILNWPYTAAMWCGFRILLNEKIKMEYKLQYKCVKFTNCQMKWGQLCLGDFLTTKIPKIKKDWLHFIWQLFLVNFTLVKMQQSCEVELVHGLTALHLATFLSEFYTCQNAAVLWSGVSAWIDSTSFGCFS